MNKMVKIIYIFAHVQTYMEYQLTILCNIFITMLIFSVVFEDCIFMY